MTEATWWKKCDHPDDACTVTYDAYYTPILSEGAVVGNYVGDEAPTALCPQCNQPFSGHGFIRPEISTTQEGQLVHPGDVIITHEDKYEVTRIDPMAEAMNNESDT